jgi:hypothetical protein
VADRPCFGGDARTRTRPNPCTKLKPSFFDPPKTRNLLISFFTSHSSDFRVYTLQSLLSLSFYRPHSFGLFIDSAFRRSQD